ncbi:MAG: hypothetical protein M1378_07295 [Bacteroidetes bacterium]|nr:hypothetical protein [Bacteroidota bacterium]
MSEYQYYEFRAIDRPLTQRQMDELRSYSSRASISSYSFVNEYDWGNFKGDPDKWMEKYFDAFLYLANWGTRWLMLRVPARVVDLAVVEEYCGDDSLTCRKKGDNLIFSFLAEEEDSEWYEAERSLASLVQLRSDLMQGDYRCLYLGWLLAVQAGEFDDDTLEPPVPPGLRSLNAPLRTLADFLRIDPDLIAEAAKKSESENSSDLTKKEISAWLTKFPPKDKDAVIMRLLSGDDPHLGAELRYRALSEIRGEEKPRGKSNMSDRRTAGQLIAFDNVPASDRREA